MIIITGHRDGEMQLSALWLVLLGGCYVLGEKLVSQFG